MKNDVMLTVASLLSILFLTFHLSDEIARGMERGGLNMVIPVFVLVVWLYGTLVLAGRRSGYIIMLVASIVGTGVPILHMAGKGLAGGRIAPTLAELHALRDLAIHRHPLGARTVEPAMAPAPAVQQPEHVKGRRAA